MKREIPNPGSDEAVEKGCQCPVMDNGRGNGSGRKNAEGGPLFWISQECKLHNRKEAFVDAD